MKLSPTGIILSLTLTLYANINLFKDGIYELGTNIIPSITQGNFTNDVVLKTAYRNTLFSNFKSERPEFIFV